MYKIRSLTSLIEACFKSSYKNLPPCALCERYQKPTEDHDVSSYYYLYKIYFKIVGDLVLQDYYLYKILFF